MTIARGGAAGPMLVRICLAVVDMPRAVAFYDGVLDTQLTAIGAHGMFEGNLGGVPLLLVPNSIAELVPGRSMHMLRLAVRDLDETLRTAIESGGVVIDEPSGQPGVRLASITDPEDNVIEFMEG